jgi:hypothetical protein
MEQHAAGSCTSYEPHRQDMSKLIDEAGIKKLPVKGSHVNRWWVDPRAMAR